MRVVIDAIPVVPFGGFAVTLEGLLWGWDQLDSDDELHLLLADGAEHEVPASVHTHRFPIRGSEVLSRIAVQSRAGRRVCRQVGADALLATIPTTAVVPVGCPKVITVHDLRHELVPRQFSRGRRLLRRVSYGIGYRQAAGLICISQRTRRDLLRSHPRLSRKPVFTIPWAADHAEAWAAEGQTSHSGSYALAFGHFPNKAVERVIDAWRILNDRGEAMPLVLVGLTEPDRERTTRRIAAAGLGDLVTVLPWLDRETFRARFASAGLVVFPSEFEGFGLPTVEAMRLGIPLVISADEALLEVTGGNATVVRGNDSGSLADAVSGAWSTPKEELSRARAFVEGYRWVDVARATRAALEEISPSATNAN